MPRRKSVLQQAIEWIEQQGERLGDVIADAADEFRRLSPKELEQLGFSRKARRYVRKTERPSKTRTISAREYETKKIERKYGKRISKETAHKLRSKGKIRYRSAQASASARLNTERAKARQAFQEDDYSGDDYSGDIKLIVKFNDVRYRGLSESEKDRFRELFKS